MDQSAYDAADAAMNELLSGCRGTLYDLVSRQYDKIVLARSMGYSLSVIAKALADAGIPISASVLRIYMKRIAAAGRKAKPVAVLDGVGQVPSESRSGKHVRAIESKERTVATGNSATTTAIPSAPPQRASVPPSAAAAPSAASAPSAKPSTGKQEEKMPPVPTDWPKVTKRVNGKDVDLWKNPKWNTLYSVLPGIDPEAPYGRNEDGVTYNLFGDLTFQVIGKGFIGVDM